MHTETIAYYDRNAGAISAQYESADMTWLYQKVESLISSGARILEIGCGSGRDARELAARGYSVTACDASTGMLTCARGVGGQGNLELLCKAFPLQKDDGLLSCRFDFVLSLAMIMHLPPDQLPLFVKQVSSMLRVNGTTFISWCNRKTEDERLYECVDVGYLSSMLTSNSFKIVECVATDDSLGRPVIWNSIVARKMPVDQ